MNTYVFSLAIGNWDGDVSASSRPVGGTSRVTRGPAYGEGLVAMQQRNPFISPGAPLYRDNSLTTLRQPRKGKQA